MVVKRQTEKTDDAEAEEMHDKKRRGYPNKNLNTLMKRCGDRACSWKRNS